MKEFLMTSPQFEGEIEFAYNDAGGLIRLDIRANLNPAQYQYIVKNLPSSVSGLMAFKENLKAIKSPADIREVVRKIDFDVFWDRYFAGRNKDNSSKKKARAKWERMSRADQLKAYQYINKYLAGLGAGIGIKYAETYLNSELWNN
ncbi:MAG: hypothetical protein LBE04_05735 [Prevotellaceae bacterium]|nr:hypothetical protein [Prevotellaceae bacterium]